MLNNCKDRSCFLTNVYLVLFSGSIGSFIEDIRKDDNFQAGRRINDIRTPGHIRQTLTRPTNSRPPPRFLQGTKDRGMSLSFPAIIISTSMFFHASCLSFHPHCDRYTLLCSMCSTTGCHSGGDRPIVGFQASLLRSETLSMTILG
jgi:hypothetical protein